MLSRRKTSWLCHGFFWAAIAGSLSARVAEADLDVIKSASEPAERSLTPHSLVTAAQLASDANTPPGLWFDIGDSVLLDTCRTYSQISDSRTYTNWADGCNPNGIIAALKARYPAGYEQRWNPPWIGDKATNIHARTDAVNAMAYWLLKWYSPIIVPLEGNGEHWVTIWKMDGTFSPVAGAMQTINHVYFRYAYPTADAGGLTNTVKGLFDGDEFTWTFYALLTKISSTCPPCVPMVDEPFLKKFVFLYDPPAGALLAAPRESYQPIEWSRSPGFLPAGERLTPERAARDFEKALQVSKVPIDAELGGLLRSATVGESYEVVGFLPEGQRRNYMVVPMLDASRQHAVLFIELDVTDGAVRALKQPGKGFLYQPISGAAAMQRAAALLHPGERLGPPALIWDSSATIPAISHTFSAFWQMSIESGSQTTDEVVRVARNGGLVLGRSTPDTALISVQ